MMISRHQRSCDCMAAATPQVFWLVVSMMVATTVQVTTAQSASETTALYSQEFILQGESSEVLNDEQQDAFEQVMASYLTGTTCNIVSQESSDDVVDAEYVLQIDYECTFAGSAILATSFYDFVRQELVTVTDDLNAAIGVVVNSFPPVLVDVNGEEPPPSNDSEGASSDSSSNSTLSSASENNSTAEVIDEPENEEAVPEEEPESEEETTDASNSINITVTPTEPTAGPAVTAPVVTAPVSASNTTASSAAASSGDASSSSTQSTSGFRQGFVVSGSVETVEPLTSEQEMLLTLQMDLYTSPALATEATASNATAATSTLQEGNSGVTTQCVVLAQTIARAETGETLLLVESECTWTSSSRTGSNNPNVEDIPDLYTAYINDNLQAMTNDLRSDGLTMIEDAWPIQVFNVTSAAPSSAPSATRDAINVTGSYAQQLVLNEMPESNWSNAELSYMSAIFAGYTTDFVDERLGAVATTCDVDRLTMIQDDQEQVFANLRYNCQYTTVQESVADNITERFVEFINANLDRVSEDLSDVGVAEALAVRDANTPSLAPTPAPEMERSSGSYTQEFVVEVASGAGGGTSTIDIVLVNGASDDFVTLVEGYTSEFGENERSVATSCQIDDQFERVDELEQAFLKVDYSCNYTALENGVNVTNYPDLFVAFVNDNLVEMTEEVQRIDETMFEALPVNVRESKTNNTQDLGPTRAPNSTDSTAPSSSNDTSVSLETNTTGFGTEADNSTASQDESSPTLSPSATIVPLANTSLTDTAGDTDATRSDATGRLSCAMALHLLAPSALLLAVLS